MSALFTLYYLGAALGQGGAKLGQGGFGRGHFGGVWDGVGGDFGNAFGNAWAAVLTAKAWARRLTISCDRSTP